MKNILVSIYLLCVCNLSAQFVPVDFIKKIKSYQNSVEIKYITEKNIDVIDSTTFHLHEYMKMFNAIEIKNKNNFFDYFYFDNYVDGRPYIYVKNKNCNFIDEIMKQINGRYLDDTEAATFVHSKIYSFLNDSVNRAFNNIVPKNSEEGFVQYLFFREFGEQFALKWHAAYKEKYVITSKDELENIIKKYSENKSFLVDTMQLKILFDINPTPTILFDKEKYVITWHEIETHNGIFQRTYSISQDFPYQIVLLEEKKIINIYMMFNY